jgi:hypothetical protein
MPIGDALEAVNPIPVGHSLPNGDGMAFLEDLVNGDEGFEGLDLIGEGLTSNSERGSKTDEQEAQYNHNKISIRIR